MLRKKITALVIMASLMFTMVPALILTHADAGTELGINFVYREDITEETPSAKWIFEQVSGNDYRLKNSETNLYLTAISMEKIVQKELDTENNHQVWNFGNHYGSLYKVTNKGLNKQLNLRRAPEDPLFFPGVYPGTGDSMIYINTQPGVYTNSAAIENNTAYYVFCRDLMGKQAPSVLNAELPQEIVLDTKFVYRTDITEETPAAKWIFEQVSGNDYRLKNFATGLYLTAPTTEKLVQIALDTANNHQVWNFGNHYGSLYKVTNKGLNKQLNLRRAPEDPLFFPGVYPGSADSMIYINTQPGVYTNAAAIENNTAYYIFCRDLMGKQAPSVLVGETEAIKNILPITYLMRDEITEEMPVAKWIFEQVNGNDYRLKNFVTNLYLSATEDKKLIQTDLNAQSNFQIWNFGNHYGAANIYKVTNKGLNQQLNLRRSAGDPQFFEKYPGTADSMIYINTQPGVYTNAGAIENNTAYYMFCRDLMGLVAPSVLVGRTENLPPVYGAGLIRPSQVDGSDIQKWVLESASDAQYRIKNSETGRYLTWNGVSLLQNELKETSANQLWKFESTKGEKWHLRNVGQKIYMEIYRRFNFDGEKNNNLFERVTLSETLSGTPAETLSTGVKYYIYSSAMSLYPDSRTILTGYDGDVEVETDEDDSNYSGDGAEVIPTEPGKYYQVLVTKYENTNGSASQKWKFEPVSGFNNRYKIKNAASGLYLSVVNKQIVQQESTDSHGQLWTLDAPWQLKFEILSVATGQAIRLDQSGQPVLGAADHSQFALVAFSSTAEGISRNTEEVNTTDSFYITNWSYKVNSTMNDERLGGSLVGTGVEVFPGTEEEDLPMENQDKANPAIEADQPVAVKHTPVSAVKKTGSQIWIFHKTAIDPVPDIRKIMDPKDTKGTMLTEGFKIQNQETGLYLTQIVSEEGTFVAQLPENQSKLQIWTFQTYATISGSYPMLNFLRNVETGHQLLMHDDKPLIYDPANYNADETDWPSLVVRYGGPIAGIATIGIARVPSDMFVMPQSPENGKGYYIYNVGHSRAGALLEAEGGAVEDQTSAIPEAAKKLEYEKNFVYSPDFTKEINSDNNDWDLLYEAEAYDGLLVGQPSSETGTYGIGLKHRTYGRGVNQLEFDLKIPRTAQGHTVIALRMNDYSDIIADRTGIRVYIDKDGRVGIKYSGASESVTYRTTGLPFEDFRRVFVEDDTDKNQIRVFFNNDSGEKVQVAELEIEKGTVALKANILEKSAPQKVLEREYGYNIYRDGYISVVNQDAYDVEIAKMKVVLPRYSAEKFPEDTKPGGSSETPGKPDKDKGNPKTGDSMPMVAGLAVISVLASITLVCTKKRKRREF